MKKEDVLVGLSLLISLFIYLFYRTERTLVNELFLRLISASTYTHLKTIIVRSLPLNALVIYSIPEGLWMFCITMTSKPYYIRLFQHRIACWYIPLVFCFSLEFLQLIHITNGRFDYMDIVIFVPFWLLGRYCFPDKNEKQHILASINTKTLFCFVSYGLVYLAHVFNSG